MKLLITGSKGVIGTVLVNGLTGDITEYDRPEFDVLNYPQLVARLRGHDAIIHLAWRSDGDNFGGERHHAENTEQVYNVYQAAVEAKVPRVIMASSVHADKFTDRTLDGLFDPYALPIPDTPYGASKCFMEALGRYYADSKGLEVICIRFGGVNPTNKIPEQPYSERQVWLRHEDCIDLVQRCLEAKTIPNNYAIIYGVSDNKDRLHDTTNPVGWHR